MHKRQARAACRSDDGEKSNITSAALFFWPRESVISDPHVTNVCHVRQGSSDRAVAGNW